MSKLTEFKLSSLHSAVLTYRNIISDDANRYIRREDETISCTLCSQTFVSVCVARSHVLYVHLGRNDNAVCNVCGKSYSKRKNLYKHLRLSHHGLGITDVTGASLASQLLECEICRKTYTKRRNLFKHLSLFHPEVDATNVPAFVKVKGATK